MTQDVSARLLCMKGACGSSRSLWARHLGKMASDAYDGIEVYAIDQDMLFNMDDHSNRRPRSWWIEAWKVHQITRPQSSCRVQRNFAKTWIKKLCTAVLETLQRHAPRQAYTAGQRNFAQACNDEQDSERLWSGLYRMPRAGAVRMPPPSQSPCSPVACSCISRSGFGMVQP
jgi:hypothetical protein